jgi:hypothetical protein
MGRIHTLRGTIESSDEVLLPPQLIFDYASTDQSRAWKVIDICFFPVTTKHTGLERSAMSAHNFQLATDLGFNQLRLDASENRTFAWETITLDNSVAAPVLVTAFAAQSACVDPDHLITDQLYLSYVPETVATESDVDFEWSYMIRLEAQKISSSESILQAIKGKGQEV